MAGFGTDIVGVLLSEFSDVRDLKEATRTITRLSVAIVLGGLIGYERQSAGKAAGVRTHICWWLWAQHYLFSSRYKPACY